MIDAVIFDLDGTLLDTLEDLYLSVNRTLKHFGYPLHTKEEVLSFVGNGIVQLLKCACPEKTDNFEECVEYFKADYALHSEDNTAPYPGITELLDAIDRRGIKCAVVSNKFDSALKALVSKYFNGHFAVVIGETPQINKKPAPDMVLNALIRLGVTAEHAVYVGDSDVDVLTAKNAGLKCISVTWGFRTKDVLIKSGACVFADTAEEILKLL